MKTYAALKDFASRRDPRPAPDQPGTLRQQVEAIELYLANPYRRIDRAAAWELARRLVLRHARRALR